MRTIKFFILSCMLINLWACSPVTPFVAAGIGNHEYVKYKQDQRVIAAAALNEEPDLITYSIQAIVNKTTDQVINTYLTGYGKQDYSQDMKSIAIYQIGLVYMNRLNDNRDDEKAKIYFQRHLIEFPYSILHARVEDRLKTIHDRKNLTSQPSREQIITQVNRSSLLSQPTEVFHQDLTPMSERAIRDNRLADANGVYSTVYENPGSSDSIKAKSLYQLGLIYASPYNKDRSISKARFFFDKIVNEFPKSIEAKKAQHEISNMINDQVNFN
jgi:transposase-like protein